MNYTNKHSYKFIDEWVQYVKYDKKKKIKTRL